MNKAEAAGIGIQQYAPLMAAISPKIAAFAPDTEIIPGLVKAVEIKGHTPGHSGYLIASGSRSLLYIGDAMHHSVVSIQKPDWRISFDADAPTAQETRKALLARTASAGQRIYAVHFPFPGLGKVVRKGDQFTWKAE
jgi:glyoxylase-like metal-dependent hydrolase (beta-lactamase superfamily II)